MLLLALFEQDYQMSPQQQQRWGKVIDFPGQAQNAPAQQQKKRSQGKDYNMKFKDEAGGGEFRVKIKTDAENQVKYNYGYYNMAEKPKIEIETQNLTPKGYKVYQQIAAILGTHNQETSEPAEQTGGQTAETGQG